MKGLLSFLCLCTVWIYRADCVVESQVDADSSQVLSTAPYTLNARFNEVPYHAVKPLDRQYQSPTSMSVKMR